MMKNKAKIRSGCVKVLIVMFLALSLSSYVSAEDIALTWEDCAKEAKANNPELKAATENLAQARYSKIVTSSSALPALSASLNGSIRDFSSNSLSYGLSTGMNIYDGNKNLNSILQAEEQIKYAEVNYNSVSASIRAKLRTAFIGVLKSQQYLDIAGDIAKRRKQSAEMVALRYDSGREHKGSVLIARANLAQSENDVKASERNLEIAQRKLSSYLGRDNFTPVAVKGDFALSFRENTKPDINKLAVNTPAVKSLQIKKKIAEYSFSYANGSYYPSLDLSASYGGSLSENPITGNLSVGLGLSYNIFDFGGRDAGVLKNKSALLQAEADEKSGILTAVLTLESFWAALQNAIDNVSVQKMLLDANVERVKISEAQYSDGIITFDSWTIIEYNLISLQKSYITNEADALAAENDWINAIGGILDYNLKTNGGSK
ncbi:MAG: hypothetical protein A2231_07465 [Candidatus Firestonebacteria bacterium RIFOXYA2_FULL_40_8]|nr:MAG: hypothetical protein A2231_07465 [Candidatus Firestonebacteria bacterium RIFOXYA2_FULL_40_8]